MRVWLVAQGGVHKMRYYPKLARVKVHTVRLMIRNHVQKFHRGAICARVVPWPKLATIHALAGGMPHPILPNVDVALQVDLHREIVSNNRARASTGPAIHLHSWADDKIISLSLIHI